MTGKPDQREELARLMGEQPTLGSLVEVFDNNGDELAELLDTGSVTLTFRELCKKAIITLHVELVEDAP